MSRHLPPPDNTETVAMLCAVAVVALPLVICLVAIAVNAILKP